MIDCEGDLTGINKPTFVVRDKLTNPFRVGGVMLDIRFYVFIFNVDPLKVYYSLGAAHTMLSENEWDRSIMQKQGRKNWLINYEQLKTYIS